MESMRIALGAVTPLTLMIALGVLLRRLKLVDTVVLNGLDRINFRVLLPVLLFDSLYSADFKTDFSVKFLLFMIGLFVIEIILWFVITPIFEKDIKKQGTLIQAMFRSNTNVFGTAIISQLYSGGHIGLVGVSMLAAVPLPQAFGIIALERCGNHAGGRRARMLNIAKNPMIIGIVVSMIAIFTKLSLPGPIESTVHSIAKAATPMALISLGGTLEFSSFRENRKDLMIGATGKALLHPLLFVPLAAALGFRGPQLATIMVVANSPVAVTVFSITRQMDGDGQLAAQLIVITTILSVVSTFFCTWVLTVTGLI